MGFRVHRFSFGVSGIWGFWDLGLRDLGFRVLGPEFGVQGVGSMVILGFPIASPNIVKGPPNLGPYNQHMICQNPFTTALQGLSLLGGVREVIGGVVAPIKAAPSLYTTLNPKP